MPTTPDPIEPPPGRRQRVISAVARPVTHARTRLIVALAVAAGLAALAPTPADAVAVAAIVLAAGEALRGAR